MARFKKGQLVRLMALYDEDMNEQTDRHGIIGQTFEIKSVSHTAKLRKYKLKDCPDMSSFRDEELELVMSKFYRVKENTPIHEKGAILKLNGDRYTAVSDLWDVVEDESGPFSYLAAVVEKNPDWFERVYEIDVLGKVKYATKEIAKETAAKLFKEK